MASVSLRNVSKVFDRHVVAVSGLTLTVPDGQFMVLVGPSGCGKTTTLRLIAGLETPTAGDISIANHVVTDVPAWERDVALVFQDSVLYPHMDVYGNMAFAPRMRKRPEAEIRQHVTATADMLGIGDLLHRKPATLSGGQCRRVALGKAIVREPAVLLFDEPLSNLDAQLHLAMRSELKRLHQRLSTTCVHVTHDQAEAMALGQQICVLREGRVQQVGPPEEIYDRPANRFVAGFFGIPPMNFLDAQVRFQDGLFFLVVGNERIDMPVHLRSRLADDDARRGVLVGIRPQDLALEPLPTGAHGILSGKVTLTEPLGARTDLHVELRSGSTCIVATVRHTQVRVGDTVHLHVKSERLHFFAGDESGRNIAPCGTSD